MVAVTAAPDRNPRVLLSCLALELFPDFPEIPVQCQHSFYPEIVNLLSMAKINLWVFFQQGARVPGEEHNLADPAGCELLP